MKLTDQQIKQATSKGKKRVKLFDGGGLHLMVTDTGAKYWRFRYRYHGLDCTLSLGCYPEISLREARQKHREAQILLHQGVNPHTKKMEEKRGRTVFKRQSTFEMIALEWYERRKEVYTNSKASQQVINTLCQYVFPYIGHYSLESITTPDLMRILDPLSQSKPETASRIKQRVSAVFDFAMQTGRTHHNPTHAMPKIMRTVEHRVKHHLALPVERIGEFFQRLAQYPNRKTQLALTLLILTLTRSGELRFEQWMEIKGNEWHIPAERMKMKHPHIVLLSNWALDILEELRSLNRFQSPYFVVGKRNKVMSDMTLSIAMKKMGYSGIAVPHGFRAMGSSILNESGLWSADAIERQLAHAENNSVRAAYNRAEYLSERKRMMEWYSHFIKDKL